jgi:hypothetical protein
MTAAPWLPPAGDGGVSGAHDTDGHGRRLRSAEGPEAVLTGPGAEVVASAHLRSLRRMRRTPLAAMGPPDGGSGGGADGGSGSSSGGAAAAGAAGAASSGPPRVVAALMRRDATLAAAEAANGAVCLPPGKLGAAVVPPRQLGLVPVTPGQACVLKGDAAVKCLMAFRSGDLLDGVALAPGEQL